MLDGLTLRCLFTIAWGAVGFFLTYPNENPKTPAFAAAIFGFGGMYISMFLLHWIFRGWGAARAMKWFGEFKDRADP